MFGVDLGLRRIQRSDFHVDPQLGKDDIPISTKLWIEADFEFEELKGTTGKHATIPTQFAHMRLETKEGLPRVRFRLEAELDAEGEIEESLTYILQTDANDEPTKTAVVPKHDRGTIQVHYLPARRDPTDQISYAATSLLGRVFRAAKWTAEASAITSLTEQISTALSANEAVVGINKYLAESWERLHKGDYYSQPGVSFGRSEIDGLLRHLTVAFSPGHEENVVSFSRLGDGQKSLLYISLVLAVQELGRQALAGKLKGWDVDKLRPALFSMIAMEEPENSLSPHYLGRVIKSLTDFSDHGDAQSFVATHSPSLLRRVGPEKIRYLRLNTARETIVKKIVMPATDSEACKFVREAVLAFPELYFSRLVILGEGDSEEIVLPRLIQARGLSEECASISVVPLGGRHVNHFWRLLHGLEIPYVTLLDLDLGRFQGGWGRIRYAAKQLLAFPPGKPTIKSEEIQSLPQWDGSDPVLTSELGKKWMERLEQHGVFFSAPLDLDFAMLLHSPSAYGLEKTELEDADAKILGAVLGPKHKGEDQYSAESRKAFRAYHKRFKLGSKPVTHLEAMAVVDEPTLKSKIPPRISRLLDSVEKKLETLPE
jgi:putative ATP-dependent endonuclease of OLD family